MINRLCSTLFLKSTLLLIFALLSLLLIKPAFAQTATHGAELSFETTRINSTYVNESPHYASMAIYNFGHALSCILVGESPIAPCLEYKIITDSKGTLSSVPVLSRIKTNEGIWGVGKSTLSAIYDNPPLKSSEFIAEFGKDIGFVKEANAQVGGSGNAVLSPVYKLWEISRNIAYLAMIIIFVIVGLMVMFRQKLNPQTVVTIQLALPGLVIGLVMITFSYFLSSLITDLAFVGTDLVGYYFQSAQTAPNSDPSLTHLTASENFISIMSRLTSGIGSVNLTSAVDNMLSNLSGQPKNYVMGAIMFVTYQYGGQIGSAALGPLGALIGLARGAGNFGVAGAGATIGSIVGNLGAGILLSTVGALAPGAILNLIIGFILVAMLIIAIFKLVFKLLNNFLSIIFYTLASPFVFLISALPGRQGLVNDWMRNMLCNVLAFPAVAAVLYFCYFILTGGQPLQAGDQLFIISSASPIPVTNYSTLPLFGGLDLRVINSLIAFGAFVATPSIPDIICKAIGKIGPAAGMLEQQISGTQRAGQGYVKQAGAAPGQVSKDFGRLRELGEEKAYNLQHEWVVQRPRPWDILTGKHPH